MSGNYAHCTHLHKKSIRDGKKLFVHQSLVYAGDTDGNSNRHSVKPLTLQTDKYSFFILNKPRVLSLINAVSYSQIQFHP